MTRVLDPSAAKALVHTGGEIAFLDVREDGQFGEGHPLFSVPCPYSRLETMVTRLAPRRTVAVLLIDAGDGVAEREAERLSDLGYTDVSIVAGGVEGWEAAGFTLFKGVNVPSKTLGELAEHRWHPETVDAATMKAWSEAESAHLFDGRPPAEFRKMHVPGATCLPNGELAHRIGALPQAPSRPIVVGCAGRTRGIIGAIGLKLAGYEGPVYALENGTQGWALAGFELERAVGAAPFVTLDAKAEAVTRDRAAAFLRRWSIAQISGADVADVLADDSRTSFVFDVRSNDEASADPIACAVHAPSGQIVQSTDQYVGVRKARLVLCDDLGLRAGLAAFWLKQLGYDPVVALLDDALRALPAPASSAANAAIEIEPVSATEALAEVDAGKAFFLDVRSSRQFRSSHVAGAVWGIRPRLEHAIADRPSRILIVSDDDDVLQSVVQELDRLARNDVATVIGGQDALRKAGAPCEGTPANPSDDDAIDFLEFVHDRHDGNLDASRRYLAWEQGLIAQLDNDERSEFTSITPAN